MASAGSFKNGAKLLFIGQNGSGKSSLINSIIGDDLTSVGDSIEPNSCHHLIKDYQITADGVTDEYVSYFDTRGFGDLTVQDRKITNAVRSTMKTADVVLICYRLYGRVDRYVTEELKEMAQVFGNELMKHAILVFTWGDEYKIHARGQFNDEASSQEEIKRQMNTQILGKVAKIREVLKKNGIKNEIADNIPYCVTSVNEDKLPCTTKENWKIEFWKKCKDRCTPESAPFMKPPDRSKMHKYNIFLTAAGLLGAIGIVGVLIGTGIIPRPGVKTAISSILGTASCVSQLGQYKEKKAKEH